MDAFASPLRLAPPTTPRRAPSPTMSPGGRRGRAYGSADEGRLRDLSPDTTLRAFTHQPVSFDTTRDEYKIFACIDSLTAAERDLGVRVAKAAQRLKSWCAEIEQWGWTGSFEQPSEQYREQRRKSIEARIREHVADTDPTGALPPLEYWGSLLSVEVEQHEARLDDIDEEMLKLDVEELKEHVLDMHPSSKSRPSSAGLEAVRQSYRPMDDFSFLITQTLLSALPHHAQLKDRLNTWTARVSILRAAPRFVSELDTAKKAMRLGWDAIEPPADTSDKAFLEWKDAVDTISRVLQGKVSDLGQRLDRMLDTLEGRQDCLPDSWIDTFEETETDYGRWAHESRRRVIELEVRRREDNGSRNQRDHIAEQPALHSDSPLRDSPRAPAEPTPVATASPKTPQLQLRSAPNILLNPLTSPKSFPKAQEVASAVAGTESAVGTTNTTISPNVSTEFSDHPNDFTRSYDDNKDITANNGHTSTDSTAISNSRGSSPVCAGPRQPTTPGSPLRNEFPMEETNHFQNVHGFNQTVFNGGQVPRIALDSASSPSVMQSPTSMTDAPLQKINLDAELLPYDDESEFEEGDTVVHYETEESPEYAAPVQSFEDILPGTQDERYDNTPGVLPSRPRPLALSNASTITSTDGDDSALFEPPQTPRSRTGSVGSLSSELSFDSGSPSNVEESPSVRNAAIRAGRAPRPELNAAMSKRRPAKLIADDAMPSTPWPPTSFAQKPANSAEELERKISDILTTIPAHIRLTSGPGADAPEVKPRRGLVAKGSRQFLRAKRSVSGLKSPELTLSPAKNEETGHTITGRKSAANLRGDNDIKLYHLTQPGKEQPVKLFIRRVGENGERVMVRVGGGWADLGEYLRQYAEHHGRRTASDGKFEILGLEVKNPDSSPARPDSATSRPGRRFSGGTSASPLTTPIKSSETSFANNEAPPRLSSFSSTPGTGEEASVPSTNSSQRSWQGNEVGLAGPKSKKLDLSGQKLEWIEGMMKQARTVSGSVIAANNTPFQRDEQRGGESRSESRSDSRAGTRAAGASKKPEFGDLGKIGGTKRIFLKGGKPVVE
ncbi:hypothetical protein T440DRAFT_469898 [Plenodomus tracheiphilus IPT5]|uniref:GAR domain-containing protein n=1 Tax=Plenodomus tracheiphilus IPT5 TaxID=1408161 RepID=A0A6A7B3A3_9PLEO|nr:hypothetical protein T440DRAFT_469898 [Plenodomus tracheiphilus IPT5]